MRLATRYQIAVLIVRKEPVYFLNTEFSQWGHTLCTFQFRWSNEFLYPRYILVKTWHLEYGRDWSKYHIYCTPRLQEREQ